MSPFSNKRVKESDLSDIPVLGRSGEPGVGTQVIWLQRTTSSPPTNWDAPNETASASQKPPQNHLEGLSTQPPAPQPSGPGKSSGFAILTFLTSSQGRPWVLLVLGPHWTALHSGARTATLPTPLAAVPLKIKRIKNKRLTSFFSKYCRKSPH